MSVVVKRHRATGLAKLRFAIIVTSTKLYEARLRGEPINDVSGELASTLVSKAGHEVIKRCLVPNDPLKLIKELTEAVDSGADVVIVSGGTGLGPYDLTVESVAPLFEKRIPGFGELFRKLSFEAVGPAAMLSRADAGVYRSSVVFLLPGSPHAVEVALTKLILPEAGHLVAEVRGLR